MLEEEVALKQFLLLRVSAVDSAIDCEICDQGSNLLMSILFCSTFNRRPEIVARHFIMCKCFF